MKIKVISRNSYSRLFMIGNKLFTKEQIKEVRNA